MHQTVTATIAAPIDKVTHVVSDLSTYPEWLDLVTAAAPAASADEQPAWLVTIRAKVGPFARSKKLRMVRMLDDTSPDRASFRFERAEVDGRDHSAWTLEITVTSEADSSCDVTMDLRYDGGLWTAPLEPILGSFISGAGPDLEAYANRS